MVTDGDGAADAVDWTTLPGANGGPLAAFNASRGGTYAVACSLAGAPCAAAA